MSFSKQRWFCNCCGKAMETLLHAAVGRSWRVCAVECLREMQWREALSVCGKPYRPQIAENSGSEGPKLG